MKVHLRDLKNGPFNLSDTVAYDKAFSIDERVQKIDKVDAHASGQKFTDSIVLDVSIDSKVRINCDRCSDEIDYDIKDRFNILMTHNENLSEFNHKDFDIVIEIKEDDIEIDLTPHLFEGINVSLPMRLAPSENEKGACSVCLKSFDFDTKQPEHHRKEFDKLKNLFK